MTTTIAHKTGSFDLSVPAAREVADRVGIAITWDAWAVAVSRADFASAVATECAAFYSLIGDTSSPSAALTRAMGRNQGAQTRDEAMRWERVIIGDPLHAVAELARGDRRDHFSAAGTLRVTVDLKTGALTHTAPSDALEQGALDALVARFTLERESLTAADLTGPGGWLRKVLAQIHAVKMSSTQAQYLVRAEHDEALVGVERALGAVGISLIPIAVTAGAARGIAATIGRTLAGEAGDLLKTAHAKLEKARAGSKVSTNTDDVRAMRERLAVLELALGAHTAEALAVLEETTRVLAAASAAIVDAENAEGRAVLASLGIA